MTNHFFRLITRDAMAAREYISLAREVSRIGLAEARISVQTLRSHFLVDGDLCNALNQIVVQKSLTTDTRIIYKVMGKAFSLTAEVDNNFLRVVKLMCIGCKAKILYINVATRRINTLI